MGHVLMKKVIAGEYGLSERMKKENKHEDHEARRHSNQATGMSPFVNFVRFRTGCSGG